MSSPADRIRNISRRMRDWSFTKKNFDYKIEQ